MNKVIDTYDYKTDDYINWLSFVNAGMLVRGNLACMRHALANLPTNDPIIEIGSFCGLSLNCINYYKNNIYKIPNKIFNCDQWIFEGSEKSPCLGFSNITRSDYREFVKETYIKNVEFFSKGDLPHTIEKISDDFFNSWENAENLVDLWGREVKLGGPVSFAYIDGNHTYEFAKNDFENVDKFLVKNGFVLLDDSADSCVGSAFEGINKLCKEIEASGKYNLVMKNPNYLFIKV